MAKGATCKTVDVASARDQAKRLLDQAEKKVGSKSSCQLKLQTARAAFDNVDALKESGLDKRNSYVRATFHAGQALACATVESIVPAAGKKARRTKASAASSETPTNPVISPAKPKRPRVRKPKAVTP